MSKHKKFAKMWSNQTELGKKFNISAIAVGKLLMKYGLKDPETKLATKKALNEEYAKSTPLKDGTPYFMWNIHKVHVLISKEYKPLSKVDYWVNEVQEMLKQADQMCDEGNDKLGYMLADSVYEEVPEYIRQEVEEKVEKLKNDKSLDFLD